MLVRRGWLFRIVCAAALGLAFGACSESHDVVGAQQPLVAGSGSAAGVRAGRAGAGGIGVAVAGAGGIGAVAGRGGAGAVGTSGACGATCADGSLLGLIAVPACCTAAKKCGLDVSSLGLTVTGCLEQHAAGTLDAACPSGSVTMGQTLQGCCRPDGTCGLMDVDNGLGLGCAAVSAGAPATCRPK